MSPCARVDNIDQVNVDPINDQGLTAAAAAARLGIKRETLYAYVSRGLIERRVASDGRTSLFDPGDVDQLRRGRRPDADGELRALIATELTRVDDHTLWIRGQDLIGLLGAGMTFPQAVDLLWAAPQNETWPNDPAPGESLPLAPITPSPLDALRIIAARRSASDPLRHDLSPKSVRSAGRGLIEAMARSLPVLAPGSDETIAASLWRRLGPVEAGTEARVRTLDIALALMIDHGLAGSTFAARIAASVRADPYAVVGAGLGVLGGPLHGAASSAVHEMLLEAEQTRDAAAAVGRARRTLGVFPGFGHQVYRQQDPRYGALMASIVDAWGDDPRLVTVYRVRDLISERSDAIPNVDLGLGSLSYLARLSPGAGEAIFAIARTAGWLAHAMEEYGEKPLRFRARARYVGP